MGAGSYQKVSIEQNGLGCVSVVVSNLRIYFRIFFLTLKSTLWRTEEMYKKNHVTR